MLLKRRFDRFDRFDSSIKGGINAPNNIQADSVRGSFTSVRTEALANGTALVEAFQVDQTTEIHSLTLILYGILT